MRRLIFAGLVAIGCASTAQQTPTSTDPNPNRWATRAECDKLVDHLVAVESLDTQHPRRDIFTAPEQSPDKYRTMVDKCTISVRKADYDCLMRANDTITVRQCYTMADVKAPIRR